MVSFFFLVEAVSERRSRRLVNDAHHFQAGDLPGVLGGLTLRVVEIGRDGDDGFGDLFAQIRFGRFFELAEDHGRNFGRGITFAVDFHARIAVFAAGNFVRHQLHLFADFVETAAHEPLNRIDRVFRVGDRLPLGDLSDQALPAFGETDNRRRGAATLLIGNHDRLAAFHDGDDRVCRAQIDTNYLAHVCLSPYG